jgi:hypothetical protein
MPVQHNEVVRVNDLAGTTNLTVHSEVRGHVP